MKKKMRHCAGGSGSEVQDGEKLLAHPCGGVRIGIAAVQEDCLLQAIKVRCAVRASFQMILDRCGSSFGNLAVKLFYQVPGNRFARVRMSVMLYHGEKSEGIDMRPF